ncbi:hypothetical protein [Peribacillus sp. Bi134]|nr:hypothetical protein [Peribacillus sp. Bi134]
MNKLGFQANSSQLMPKRKLPLRQRRMIQQGFQQHFQAAVCTKSKIDHQ